MICPSCGEERDPIGTDIVLPLALCPACERSLVIEDGRVRLATSADTASLTDAQLTALKKLRTQTRAARQAYHAAH